MQVYMSRKITFLTLFLWLMTVTFPVIAQQKTDTTYTFRFVPQKDMFYVPWNGNDTELARLLECIENLSLIHIYTVATVRPATA